MHGRCVCVCGRGACMAGGRGIRGSGACVAGGACVTGERATAADGTHPTGMHSCSFSREITRALTTM